MKQLGGENHAATKQKETNKRNKMRVSNRMWRVEQIKIIIIIIKKTKREKNKTCKDYD
jgi:hypothetical protein